MAFYLFKGAKMNNRISKIVLITLATVAAVLVFIRPSVSRGASMANPDLGTYDNDLEIDISVNIQILSQIFRMFIIAKSLRIVIRYCAYRSIYFIMYQQS